LFGGFVEIIEQDFRPVLKDIRRFLEDLSVHRCPFRLRDSFLFPQTHQCLAALVLHSVQLLQLSRRGKTMPTAVPMIAPATITLNEV